MTTPDNDWRTAPDDERYARALAALHEVLQFGIEASLEGMFALMEFIGNPERAYPSIQIAGTNGKTSTARFTAAILKACGYQTGLYTSPELIEYPERIELDGQVISHGLFASVVLEAYDAAQEAIAKGLIGSITEFEVLTAAALSLYAQRPVDFAVLEVGLGGRWDATSVVTPVVAVVTGIGLDHINILGDTVEKIAAEKAAIIKPGGQAILGPGTAETRQVFLDRCAEVGATYQIIETPSQPAFDYLGPSYQQTNIAVARAAVETALGHPVEHETVQRALNDLVIPGRFETIRAEPLLMIDASHNPQSAIYLRQALLERYGLQTNARGEERLNTLHTLLLGILADKDAKGIIEALTPLFSQLVVTQSTSDRAIEASELASLVEAIDGRRPAVYADVEAAFAAVTASGQPTMATGSITIAGEVKAACTGRPQRQHLA